MKRVVGTPRLKVKVIAPTQLFYEGGALSVSALNKVGPFDVLADHANFFSLLESGDIVVDTGTQHLHFPITHGLMKVHNNNVTLFIYLPEQSE